MTDYLFLQTIVMHSQSSAEGITTSAYLLKRGRLILQRSWAHMVSDLIMDLADSTAVQATCPAIINNTPHSPAEVHYESA